MELFLATPFLDLGEMMMQVVNKLYYFEVTTGDLGTFRLIDLSLAPICLSMLVDVINWIVRGPAHDGD